MRDMCGMRIGTVSHAVLVQAHTAHTHYVMLLCRYVHVPGGCTKCPAIYRSISQTAISKPNLRAHRAKVHRSRVFGSGWSINFDETPHIRVHLCGRALAFRDRVVCVAVKVK